MICPKCSREMGSEQLSCHFCGFTFRTPNTQNSTAVSAPFPSRQNPLPNMSGAFPLQDTAADTGYRPAQHTYASAALYTPLTALQYLGILLLGLVPLAGFITYVVWLCKKSGNPYRRAFLKAMVILKTTFFCFFLGALIIYILFYTPLFLLFW